MDTYARFPISLTRGRGVWVWDSNDKRYLDCVDGIAFCTLGHSDRRLKRPLSRQLGKLQQACKQHPTP